MYYGYDLLSNTISVRVSDDLKRKLSELDINVSEIVRSCLEETVRVRENLAKLEEVNNRLASRSLKIPEGTASTLIREDRDLER